MGAMARPVLHSGRVRLSGSTPNGQWFQAAPRQLWAVTGSSARWQGSDVGTPEPLPQQSHLADIWLAQRGLFYTGTATFQALDSDRHAPAQVAASG